MRKSLLVILLCIISIWSSAQSQEVYKKYNIYRNPFRVFINKFSWTVSSGYGLTFYRHDLDGFYFYQDRDNQLILDNTREVSLDFQGYGGWLSQPYEADAISLENPFDVPYNYIPDPVNNPGLIDDQLLLDTDTMDLRFSSIASTVPVTAKVHYNFNRFRLGLGFQYERHYLRPMNPSSMMGIIRKYEPQFETTSYTKFFGLAGYQFYDWWDYSFALELLVGRAKPGKELNTDALGPGQKWFTNIGINIERNLSEYFRIIIRPSYDIKSYIINLPDASTVHNFNSAFLINVGISINIPEIPRSPMKSDHVQLKHVIYDPKNGRLMEVRGQPIWKKQNPKVGENHRKLWRYKWRNRRKLDPY